MTCGCGKVEGCCCDPKTVCEKVCQTHFNLWIHAEKIDLKKCGKYVKLVFSGLRGIKAYQVYNEFNKKLNCDRKVFKVSPQNDMDFFKNFVKRTSYLEFQSCADKHIGFSFYLGDAEYDKEKNELVLTKNIADKLFMDGVLITDYKYFKGKNVNCSVDSVGGIGQNPCVGKFRWIFSNTRNNGCCKGKAWNQLYACKTELGFNVGKKDQQWEQKQCKNIRYFCTTATNYQRLCSYPFCSTIKTYPPKKELPTL